MAGKHFRNGSGVEVGSGRFRYRVVEDWFRLPPDIQVQEVVAVACDSEGSVYVFNRGSHPLLVFEPCGSLISSLEWGNWSRPHGITVGPDDTVYCVDDFDHTIQKFSGDGHKLLQLGTSGQSSNTGAQGIDYRTIRRSGPPFNYPTNVALAGTGELYVSDGYGNARVHCFSVEGQLLHSWGEPGAGPGQFQVPHGIAISPDQIVHVADRENNRIQRFKLDGSYLDEWTNVVRPCEVFVAEDGTAYVAELGGRAGRWPGWPAPSSDEVGGRLSIFDDQGRLLARWGGGNTPCSPGDFFAPHDVWVDRQGAIYVAEVIWSAGGSKGLVPAECHTLQKFTRC